MSQQPKCDIIRTDKGYDVTMYYIGLRTEVRCDTLAEATETVEEYLKTFDVQNAKYKAQDEYLSNPYGAWGRQGT